MFKLGHIELFVSDPLASKKFYIDVLGFELVTVQNEALVWVKSGEMEILLRPGNVEHVSRDYQSAQSGLVLYTDQLTEIAKKLEERGLVFKGTDGSEGCLTFTDPDGHWFQLVDPEHG